MVAALLAFDTSTESMAVALHAAGAPATWNGLGGAQASADLLPRIGAMLAERGLQARDLDAIAFGVGPGAFTGLRTACSVAQGLALATGRPVVPVDSLLLVAEDERARRGATGIFDVGVAMDARMGELYAARYRHDGTRWQTLSAPALCDPTDLPALWRGWPDAVCGSGVGMLGGSPAAPVPTAPADLPPTDRAAALLRLALALRAEGVALDAADALPIYLRDKVALTTDERAAVKAAAAAAPAGGSA